jgi:hypothetical protein
LLSGIAPDSLAVWGDTESVPTFQKNLNFSQIGRAVFSKAIEKQWHE